MRRMQVEGPGRGRWIRYGVAVAMLYGAATARPESGADAPWNPAGASHGITVSTRAFAGSAYPEVRASGTVCATLPTLVDYIEDAAEFDRWIPDTLDARLLAEPSARQRIFYIRTGMPWPVKPRDMIYRLTAPNAAVDARTISVSIEGLPDYLPPDPKSVRMKGVRGRWNFVDLGGRTRIDLDVHFEPGGGIPAWLATRRIVATPSAMLANLKAHFASGCPR